MKTTKTIECDGCIVYVRRPRQRGGNYHYIFHRDGQRLGEISSGCSCAEKAATQTVLAAKLAEVLNRPVGSTPGLMVKKNSLDAALTQIGKGTGQHWTSDGSRNQFDSGIEFFREHVGDARRKPLRQVPREAVQEVFTALKGGGFAEQQVSARARILKMITNKLIAAGLTHTAGDIFDGCEFGTQPEAAGEPYTYADYRGMLAHLPAQSLTVVKLLWLGFSGAQELFRAATLERSAINLATGKVQYDPGETVMDAEFVLVADGLECLRNEPAESGELYLFPDIVHTDAEKKIPGYKQQRVDLTDKRRQRHIRKTVKAIWAEFMKAAGVAGEGKSFSSFRKELMAHLLSMNLKETVVANMLGITVGALKPYDYPAEWELYCVRDVREKHLAAIRAGVEQRDVISHTEVALEMSTFLKDFCAAMDLMRAQQHAEIEQQLSVAGVSTAEHVSKAVSLHAANDGKRHDQLQTVAGQVRRLAQSYNATLELVRSELLLEAGWTETATPSATSSPQMTAAGSTWLPQTTAASTLPLYENGMDLFNS